MKKYLILLLIIFSSCAITKQRADKKLDQITRQQPKAVIEKCSQLFNPLDSLIEVYRYIQGDTIFDTIEVVVNCDSIVKHTIDTVPKPVIIKAPKIIRVDTVKHEVEKVINDKAKEASLQRTIDSLKTNLTVTQTNLKTKTKNYNILLWMVGLYTLFHIVKLWFTKKLF
ncbi:MAG TPA: hypothetical protein PKI83_01330 [Bacteroidales bacterium]|nr:hypothetical protein [Bacteroidales bacterium]